MSNTVYKTGSVPTVRYRILAIVFFILAVAGLFLGFLAKFAGIFQHSAAVLFDGSGLALNLSNATKPLLGGTLFGYVYESLKLIFLGKISFGGSFLTIIKTVLWTAQVFMIPVAVLGSLVLGIIACIKRETVSRTCAMVSGMLVVIAYMWPLLAVMFVGANTVSPVLKIGKWAACSFDMNLAIVGGAALLIMLVTAVCRRKFVGLFNALLVVLLLAATYALIYPTTTTYGYLADLAAKTMVWKIIFLGLAVILGANLVLAVCRLNAKKGYIFDTVRYGLLLLWTLVTVALLMFMVKGQSWNYIFKHDTYFVIVLLASVVLAFLLSFANIFLVRARRRAAKAKRISAELSEDEIDREDDAVGYEPTPVAQQNAPSYEPAAAYEPAPQPAGMPYTVVQPVPVPQPMPQPQVQPQPAAQQNANPYIQPIPAQPIPAQPVPMGQPMVQPAYGYPQGYPQNYQQGYQQGYQQNYYGPQTPVYGGASSPVILQQAPAPAPVIVLQMPQANQAQPQPQPAVYQQPIAQPQPAAYQQPMAQPQVQPQPQAAPAPAPAPEVSDFERRMLALAHHEEPAPAPAAAPAPQAAPAPAPATAPAETAAAAPAPEKNNYYGPRDPFFGSLNEDERNEFYALFVNKTYGDFGLPTYQVGGDNTEFFKKVFICLGKFRTKISDDLIGKIYDYTNN